ncbi:hypothetical protein ACQP1K_00790 [Sphaerimonospora sp. CA-214678]|uniref:hypothetical protein n=1 Tax=Sphaerimonospora sp. CA-214678 TaxID=3240029 RepID=UPI003D8D8306
MSSIGTPESKSNETKLCRISFGVHLSLSSPAACRTFRKSPMLADLLTPTPCPDCEGEGQALIAQVIGRGLRRRTVQQYAACLTCSGTGHTPNGGESA